MDGGGCGLCTRAHGTTWQSARPCLLQLLLPAHARLHALTLLLSPRLLRDRMSSKLSMPVSSLHRPQKVPPPMLVPAGNGRAAGAARVTHQRTTPRAKVSTAASKALGHFYTTQPSSPSLQGPPAIKPPCASFSSCSPSPGPARTRHARELVLSVHPHHAHTAADADQQVGIVLCARGEHNSSACVRQQAACQECRHGLAEAASRLALAAGKRPHPAGPSGWAYPRRAGPQTSSARSRTGTPRGAL